MIGIEERLFTDIKFSFAINYNCYEPFQDRNENDGLIVNFQPRKGHSIGDNELELYYQCCIGEYLWISTKSMKFINSSGLLTHCFNFKEISTKKLCETSCPCGKVHRDGFPSDPKNKVCTAF